MNTTELSFLIELLLDHKLPMQTRKAIAERIHAVEISLCNGRPNSVVSNRPANNLSVDSRLAGQSASMQAIMLRNPDLLETTRPGSAMAEAASTAAPTEPAPVAVIAQTTATIAAMNSRAAAISASIKGVTDKTTGRPRKF